MLAFDLIRIAERGARMSARSASQQPPRKTYGLPGALVLGGIVVAVFAVGAHHHDTANPPAPAMSASWYQDKACGLPEQDFNTVTDDLTQLQQAYQMTALNTQSIQTQLQADTAAAQGCQPSAMPAGARRTYNLGLAQAAAAAASNGPAMGSHLTIAQTLLNRVAAQTGENA